MHVFLELSLIIVNETFFQGSVDRIVLSIAYLIGDPGDHVVPDDRGVGDAF